jgi:hypothetical protein
LPEAYSPASKIAAVARQVGVSRSGASRGENAPGTRVLIAEVFEPHRERLSALFDQVLEIAYPGNLH